MVKSTLDGHTVLSWTRIATRRRYQDPKFQTTLSKLRSMYVLRVIKAFPRAIVLLPAQIRYIIKISVHSLLNVLHVRELSEDGLAVLNEGQPNEATRKAWLLGLRQA